MGRDAPNLSPSVIADCGAWEADYARWQRRDLSARRYVYVWADGIYLQARWSRAECTDRRYTKKELLGFQVGIRESTNAGANCRRSRRAASKHRARARHRRYGFWKALDARRRPGTSAVTANVRQNAQICPASGEVRPALERAGPGHGRSDLCREVLAKYEKAVTCLVKDRDALLTCYDFPAEHWDHLRIPPRCGTGRCDQGALSQAARLEARSRPGIG